MIEMTLTVACFSIVSMIAIHYYWKQRIDRRHQARLRKMQELHEESMRELDKAYDEFYAQIREEREDMNHEFETRWKELNAVD